MIYYISRNIHRINLGGLHMLLKNIFEDVIEVVRCDIDEYLASMSDKRLRKLIRRLNKLSTLLTSTFVINMLLAAIMVEGEYWLFPYFVILLVLTGIGIAIDPHGIFNDWVIDRYLDD